MTMIRTSSSQRKRSSCSAIAVCTSTKPGCLAPSAWVRWNGLIAIVATASVTSTSMAVKVMDLLLGRVSKAGGGSWHRPATVGADHLTGDEAGRVGDQVGDQEGLVDRLADDAER